MEKDGIMALYYYKKDDIDDYVQQSAEKAGDNESELED